VFSGLGVTLCRNGRAEYLNVTFKGCWKGSSQRWFHIDLGDAPQWPNKHFLLSLIADKQKAFVLEEKLTKNYPSLIRLVFWVRLSLSLIEYAEKLLASG
jgi:hypothetical protein